MLVSSSSVSPCQVTSMQRRKESRKVAAISIICSVQCAVCSVQCAACSVQCVVCIVLCAVCSVQCAMYCVQCAVRTPLELLHRQNSWWQCNRISLLQLSSPATAAHKIRIQTGKLLICAGFPKKYFLLDLSYYLL